MNSGVERILVVEDDPSLRRFLRTSLDACGYAVSDVATGQEALGRMALDRPDVVVLDLGLPDVDGVDIVARVREWSETPIIVISSRDAEASKITALDRLRSWPSRVSTITLSGSPVRLDSGTAD